MGLVLAAEAAELPVNRTLDARTTSAGPRLYLRQEVYWQHGRTTGLIWSGLDYSAPSC